MKVNREWRALQIAAMIIYRNFKSVKINISSSPIYDLLVTYEDGSELKFGIKVRSSTYKSSSAFQEELQQLYDYDFKDVNSQLPIILMCVNEQSESATFGFIVGWRYGSPHIYRDFEMKQMNQDNADKVINIIKIMDNVIRIIDQKDFNILKCIEFSDIQFDGRIQPGKVLYLRKLSSIYKMSNKEIVDDKERFNRLLNGIPEDEYPSDIIDNVIYNSVRERYNNAIIKSSLILFTTDLRDLQYYNRCIHYSTEVSVRPDIFGVADQLGIIQNRIEIPTIPIEIYTEHEIIRGQLVNVSFSRTLPIQEWLDFLGRYKYLQNTIDKVSNHFIKPI